MVEFDGRLSSGQFLEGTFLASGPGPAIGIGDLRIGFRYNPAPNLHARCIGEEEGDDVRLQNSAPGHSEYNRGLTSTMNANTQDG